MLSWSGKMDMKNTLRSNSPGLLNDMAAHTAKGLSQQWHLKMHTLLSISLLAITMTRVSLKTMPSVETGLQRTNYKPLFRIVIVCV